MRSRLFLLAIAATAMIAAAPPAPHVVFIASDSTASPYRMAHYPQTGWGQMLHCAFNAQEAVADRAIGGRSTRTFINEGRLAGIARDIRPGDTLLIQFGHNDANTKKPERYAAADTTYRDNLKRFIAVARDAEAQPVLLTPVSRRNFDGAVVKDSFPDYSRVVKEVAAETGTPMIDLQQLTAQWVQEAGPDASRAFYLHYKPGEAMPGFPEGIDDDTHFSELGARGIADIVAGALAKLDIPLARHVLAERPGLSVTTPLGDRRCR